MNLPRAWLLPLPKTAKEKTHSSLPCPPEGHLHNSLSRVRKKKKFRSAFECSIPGGAYHSQKSRQKTEKKNREAPFGSLCGIRIIQFAIVAQKRCISIRRNSTSLLFPCRWDSCHHGWRVYDKETCRAARLALAYFYRLKNMTE